MTAPSLSSDVLALVRLLAKHEVRYVVVGGVAVIHHGYGRLTGDADFFYDRSASNADRLFRALAEFWGGDVPGLDSPRDLRRSDLIVQFGRPPNRIDLISTLGSVDFDRAWDARATLMIQATDAAVPLQMISLADLRASKRDAGRAKDLDDLEHLPATAPEA